MSMKNIYYQVYERLAPQKEIKTKNLVLIHGFMGSTLDWDPLVNFLLTQSTKPLKIINILLPGHTQDVHNALKNHLSTKEFSPVENLVDKANNSIQKLPAQILEIQHKENILNCTYLGYSMGARVAMEAASLNEKTESLILESSFTHWDNKEEQGDKKKEDLALLKALLILKDQKCSKNIVKKKFKTFLSGWYNLDLFKGLSKQKNFSTLIETRLQQNVEQLHKALQAYSSSTQDSYLGVLKNLNCSVFYIYGEQDIKYKTIALNLKKVFCKVNLHEIKSASHNTHFQQPLIFNKLVLDILLC